MRIAVFVKGTIFHAQYGGLETQNQVLCEGLLQKGHELHIFSPKKELTESYKEYQDIFYHFVESKYKMGWILGFFGTLDKNNWINRSHEEFAKLNSNSKFDVVISQSSAGLGVIKHKQDYAFKSLMVAHGSIVSEYKTFLSEVNLASPQQLLLLVKNSAFAVKNFFTRQRECVLNVNHVVAVSNFVKNALVEETFAPEEKFTVINNGIASPNFDVSTKNYEADLLYVGRIEKSKGLHILFKALADLKTTYSSFKLGIVGKGPETENLKNLATDLSLDQNIEFIGWTEKDELAKLYATYSIFVLPTIRVEGFPMTLVEASAYGMALVASDIGGNSDAVKPELTGLLAKAGDSTDLAQKLRALLSDVPRIKDYGYGAKKYFDDHLTRDIMVNEYEEVLKKL